MAIIFVSISALWLRIEPPVCIPDIAQCFSFRVSWKPAIVSWPVFANVKMSPEGSDSRMTPSPACCCSCCCCIPWALTALQGRGRGSWTRGWGRSWWADSPCPGRAGSWRPGCWSPYWPRVTCSNPTISEEWESCYSLSSRLGWYSALTFVITG